MGRWGLSLEQAQDMAHRAGRTSACSPGLTYALQTGHRQQYANQMEAKPTGEAPSECWRGSCPEETSFSFNRNLIEP